MRSLKQMIHAMGRHAADDPELEKPHIMAFSNQVLYCSAGLGWLSIPIDVRAAEVCFRVSTGEGEVWRFQKVHCCPFSFSRAHICIGATDVFQEVGQIRNIGNRNVSWIPGGARSLVDRDRPMSQGVWRGEWALAMLENSSPFSLARLTRDRKYTDCGFSRWWMGEISRAEIFGYHWVLVGGSGQLR